MKKLLFFLLLCILPIINSGQPWNYNFGTNTGTFNTASGISTDFLPNSEVNGGLDRVRIGTTGGSWNMENQVITFGSSSYLRGVAPTSASINKFSIYDYTAATSFTFRFKIRLGDASGQNTASSGTWSLFIGDGAIYSDNSSFSGTQVFTGIRFVYGASGAITSSYRNAGSWSNSGITGTPFAQGTTYLVEIYGNNSTATINYTYGTSQSVAVDKFDLWVDGVLVGNDLSKAQLANNTNIDSFMFYGESSTSNVANIFLDDIIYTNSISNNPLPVELKSFTGNVRENKVQLNWQTATEVNNYGFEIERNINNIWEKIGFVKGSGNSNSEKNYSFQHSPNSDGVYSYRLKQIDFDGKFEYSSVVEVDFRTVTDFALEQNYPNPFNPATSISYSIPQNEFVTLKVYDLIGNEIATLVNTVQESGQHNVTFNVANLSSGIYFYKLTAGSFSQINKMLLVK